MTIQEQLNEIKTEKENIKTVLINKGIDLTGISFTEYHNILKDYNFQIPIETTLTSTVNNTSIHYGATVTISGTISATDSTILSGQTVTLYNDTTSVGTATIDSTGAYSLTYTVQTMTSPNLTVKYAGKGLYTASTSEVPVLTISKADTVITLSANPTTVSSGGSTTLTVTLKDEWGNNLNGETVKILNGTTELYSGIIVSNSYTTTYSPTTNVTIKSNYTESEKYNTSTSSNITISMGVLPFTDDCSTNANLSNYTNATQTTLEGGGSASITYDSTNKCYLSTYSGTGLKGLPLIKTSADVHIECLMKYNTSLSNQQMGVCFYLNSSNFVLTKQVIASSINQLETNMEVSGSQSNLGTVSLSCSAGTYYLINIDKSGTNIKVNIKNTSGTSLGSASYTINSVFSNVELYYGLVLGYNSGTVISFKNISITTI